MTSPVRVILTSVVIALVGGVACDPPGGGPPPPSGLSPTTITVVTGSDFSISARRTDVTCTCNNDLADDACDSSELGRTCACDDGAAPLADITRVAVRNSADPTDFIDVTDVLAAGDVVRLAAVALRIERGDDAEEIAIPAVAEPTFEVTGFTSGADGVAFTADVDDGDALFTCSGGEGGHACCHGAIVATTSTCAQVEDGFAFVETRAPALRVEGTRLASVDVVVARSAPILPPIEASRAGDDVVEAPSCQFNAIIDGELASFTGVVVDESGPTITFGDASSSLVIAPDHVSLHQVRAGAAFSGDADVDTGFLDPVDRAGGVRVALDVVITLVNEADASDTVDAHVEVDTQLAGIIITP